MAAESPKIPRGRTWSHPVLRSDVFLLINVGAICGCLWLFIEVAEEVREGDHLSIEARIIRSLRDPEDASRLIGPAGMAEVARDLSALGGPAVLTLVTGLTVTYLLILRRRRLACFVGLTVIGAMVISTMLKSAFDRTRPDETLQLMRVASASFPSGHAMLSTVVYLTVAVLLTCCTSRRGVQLFFVSAALELSFLVGLSRVFLGVHYPSDVVSGWTAGIAWSLLCWSVAARLQRTGRLDRIEDAA